MGTKTGHGLKECGWDGCTGPGKGNRDDCGKGKETVGNAKIIQEDDASNDTFYNEPTKHELKLEQLHEEELAQIDKEIRDRNTAYAKEKTKAENKQSQEKKRQEKHAAIVAKNNQRARDKALKAIEALEYKVNKKPEKPKSPGLKTFMAAHAKDLFLAILSLLPLPISTKVFKRLQKNAMKPIRDYHKKMNSYKRGLNNYSKNSKKMRYALAKMRKDYNNGNFSAYRNKDPDYFTYVYGASKAA